VDRWEELFRPSNLDSTASPRNAINTGKTILVTGAGGCIGSALARAIASAKPRFLVLLDHSEENLYQIQIKIEERYSGVPQAAILGDILDRDLLQEVFENHRPDIVYHAAAYKHVPLMEENPLAVIRNNVMGTQSLAQVAAEFGVARLLMISTDKAVNPRSAMGVSKRIAEQLLQRMNSPKTRMSAVRFGNVFGSTGSVVPRFVEQIAEGGPVTVTHPEASRYFITLPEAVEIVLAAVSNSESGVFVPKLGEQMLIVELAKRMIADARKTSGREIPLEFVGLRPGEKLKEQLVSEDEVSECMQDESIYRVRSSRIEDEKLDALLARLSETVGGRNLAGALEIVSSLVPEYVPSEALLALAKTSMVREKT
jgi:FlaA1/EpsC-like NDP-sugar epimerase